MAIPRAEPYVWTTWVTRLMAGEATCEWAAWFRAHHTYDRLPSDFNLAKWTMEHTALLREHVVALRADGYDVFAEEQNAFKMRGQRGVTLSGKPDIVALRDNTLLVIDCKTGQPRHSDHIQVLVYMLILPYVRTLWKGRDFCGRVQYKDNAVEIPGAAVDDAFRTLFRHTMTQVGGDHALTRVPSYTECRYCDISRGDCPQRIDEPPLDVEPGHDLF